MFEIVRLPAAQRIVFELVSGFKTRDNVDLEGVPAIGDSLRDLLAGAAVGCRPMLVRTGKGEKTLEGGGLPEGTLVFADLSDAVDHLLGVKKK